MCEETKEWRESRKNKIKQKINENHENHENEENNPERPAGGDRRPLAGIFRVRDVSARSCLNVVCDGDKVCSGILGRACCM